MTGPVTALPTLDFDLPPELEATAPPEIRGRGRDDVRLLVGHRHSLSVEHRQFTDLPSVLTPDDIIVINTSGTRPAALPALGPAGDRLELHLSTPVPVGGLWTVELRVPDGPASRPFREGQPGWRLRLPGAATAELLTALGDARRLWVARVDRPGGIALDDYLCRYGRPIRYSYTGGDWPLSAYQTVYATEFGSAEMPSAGRAFTAEMVTALVAAGIDVAPLLLHTGVSSLEDHEPPFAEWYRVPAATARRINSARAVGGRVIAVGTTVVRALETVADASGRVHPGDGWTEVVITPERGVRAVDGLLSGWHEPRASHLSMLEAVAGRPLLERSYSEALAAGYLWHEFGDLHLIVP
jgi:S-adenosylmethionine:tRNA ribosyltransferase-isomerase